MDYWADLWAALTGFGTLALAVATFCVIRQSQQQRADAERQHREQFKPVCLLAPHEALDVRNWRSALLGTVAPTTENPVYGAVILHCVLRNVGVGPAMKLRLRFRFLDMAGWTSDPWELSPLGAGEAFGRQAQPIRVPFLLSDHFNATDFAGLAGKPWEILIDYEDVFGRQFRTVHSKGAFDTDPATFNFAPAVDGEQPKAILRAIPWTSYSEGLNEALVEGNPPDG